MTPSYLIRQSGVGESFKALGTTMKSCNCGNEIKGTYTDGDRCEDCWAKGQAGISSISRSARIALAYRPAGGFHADRELPGPYPGKILPVTWYTRGNLIYDHKKAV